MPSMLLAVEVEGAGDVLARGRLRGGVWERGDLGHPAWRRLKRPPHASYGLLLGS
jgi:hypothetical protein